MSKLFNKVPVRKLKKSKFDLSHENKLSCNMAELIPILVQEIVPGDSFRVSTEIMMRLAPMLSPMMHRVNVKTEFFFVPNRLVFDDWQKFITGGEDGADATIPPFIAMNDEALNLMGNGTLADYLGFNYRWVSGVTTHEPINSLPFRAYQLIYNEFYRDQNLQTAFAVPKTPGQEQAGSLTELLKIRKRAWEKDYFTSALPWPQKGGEVLIPIDSDVEYLPQSLVKSGPSDATGDLTATAGALLANGVGARIENISSVTNGTATINDLRRASRLQEWLERNARSGSRYIEQILSMFGIRTPDYRLQRPEFLGASSQPIIISEVLSSFQNAEIPQGMMTGHGISVGQGHGFKHFFNEHGFVIGLMSIVPKTAYYQGLNKMWSRQDKLDYYWPDFAQIGEQEILNKEIYYQADNQDSLNSAVFGYTPRYAEYKFRSNEVHGEFKGDMDFWHLGRAFETRPNLNSAFVECNPDDERIWNVVDTNTHHFYVNIYHKVDALRLMPYFGTPKL